MKKHVGAAISLFFNIIAASTAFSNGNSEKAFVIKGAVQPTEIFTRSQAIRENMEFMRMPDLDKKNGTSKQVRESPKDSSSHEKSVITHFHASHHKETSLKFATSKISGSLRMPRVKFARNRISTELRDEMPNLDFVQKSLKDSGF